MTPRDFRENTLQDVITKLEPELFLAVTGRTVKDFHLLVGRKRFSLLARARFCVSCVALSPRRVGQNAGFSLPRHWAGSKLDRTCFADDRTGDADQRRTVSATIDERVVHLDAMAVGTAFHSRFIPADSGVSVTRRIAGLLVLNP